MSEDMGLLSATDMPKSEGLSLNFSEALLAEESQKVVDLTLPWTKFVGPGTKTLKNIVSLSKPVEGVDLIAMKHDLRYGYAPNLASEAKADLQAIYENATTAPTGLVDLLTKPLLTVGLGLKTLFWNAHPVNIWKNIGVQRKTIYPPKEEVQGLLERKGMRVIL